MDSAVVLRNETIREPGKQQADILELHRTAISRSLQYSALLLGDQEWLEGSSFSLADIALASAAIYLDLRFADLNWRAANPNLAAWFERISLRPSVSGTLE